MNATLTILALAASLVVLLTVWTYERLLTAARAERDAAVADCELFSELLIEQTVQRHPSQFGGGNLRLIK